MAERWRSRRWQAGVAVALLATGVGVFERAPAILLSAVVAVVFAAYPRLTRPPPDEVTVERDVDPPSPDHGEEVTVTLTVGNDGERTIPDLRVVDGVPPMLAVSGDVPRHAATLAPGETTSFSYAVTARHGDHRFQPVTVLVRDRSGAPQLELTVPVETTLRCRSPVDGDRIRALVGHRAGRAAAGDPDSGARFDAVREYRHADPMRRIDWNRLASTGELRTVVFREERTSSVLVCLDARPPAYRAVGPGGVHAVFDGAFAATELVRELLESSDAVGGAVLGERLRWNAPGPGRRAGRRAMELFAEYAEAPPDAVEEGSHRIDSLVERLDGRTRVVLVSPLVDRLPVEAVRRLAATGTSVTVVSPNPTTANRFRRVVRDTQLRLLARMGVPVADWTPGEPLSAAIAAASRGPRR